jgi:putative ABC transport system permease protein
MGSFSLLFRFALDGLSGQPGRTLLTMLGMAIGTASVVAVVSIGLVGRAYVLHLIEGVGSNLVIAGGNGEGLNPDEIDFDDVDLIVSQVPGIRAIAPVLKRGDTLTIDGESRPIGLVGTPPAYERVRNLETVSGRFFTDHEEATTAKVCVISEDLAEEIYGHTDVTDEWLRLFNLRFRILGVYREKVQSAAAVGKSDAAGLTAIVPFSTVRALSDASFVDTVFMEAVSPEAVADVIRGVEEVIASRHDDLDSFEVRSLDEYLDLARQISDAITLGLMGIAAVSLLVAGIGIMNIMMVTVTERTSDIGIRLALGAGRRAVMVQFLMEAALLSLTGGLIGVALGAGLPLYIGMLYDISVPVSAASVVVAFTVSVAVGLFFGLYPARRAANMNIIEALGYN